MAVGEDRIGTLNNDLVILWSTVLLNNRARHFSHKQNLLLTSFQYHDRLDLDLGD